MGYIIAYTLLAIIVLVGLALVIGTASFIVFGGLAVVDEAMGDSRRLGFLGCVIGGAILGAFWTDYAFSWRGAVVGGLVTSSLGFIVILINARWSKRP